MNAVSDHDFDAIWHCLTEDVHVPVWLLDDSGRIEFATRAALEVFGDGKPVVGRTLTELFGPSIGAERCVFVARVLQTGRPLMFYEMLGGRSCRTVMRRLGAGRSARILVVHQIGHHRVTGPRPDELERYEVIEPKAHDYGALADLSKRELQVLALIGEGLSTAQIAQRLGRKSKTVEWHRSSIGRKLKVGSKVELVRLANGAGLQLAEPKLSHTDADDPRAAAQRAARLASTDEPLHTLSA